MAWVFILSLSLFSSSVRAQVLHAPCSIGYLQGCKSCEQLKRVVEKAAPNDGEYYRGAQWNGLYAAYVHNCFDVAEKILIRGGNPNWGGQQGSMILSVTSRWPHNNIYVNKKWVALLLEHGASARKNIPEQDKTSEQLAKEWDAEIEYPELWKKFLR